MIRRPPRSTRTDTLFPTRRSSDLPALYYLVQDPDGFLAHTLRYFTYAHHDYWQTLDEPKVMGMAGKLQIAEQMRSEEHTSELQSLMRISYAVFCLKKKIPQFQ